MAAETIRPGYDVFLHDGEHSFGAVRQVHPHEVVIYVENAGDFTVPRSAVKDVHDEKVILNGGLIGEAMREAIARAHRGEDPRI